MLRISCLDIQSRGSFRTKDALCGYEILLLHKAKFHNKLEKYHTISRCFGKQYILKYTGDIFLKRSLTRTRYIVPAKITFRKLLSDFGFWPNSFKNRLRLFAKIYLATKFFLETLLEVLRRWLVRLWDRHLHNLYFAWTEVVPSQRGNLRFE